METVYDERVDWFAIDLNEFAEAYVESVMLVAKYHMAQEQFEACEEGYCTHERRKKKDGTPHKGVPCPRLNDVHMQMVRLNNEVHYCSHVGLFQRIGLIGKEEV